MGHTGLKGSQYKCKPFIIDFYSFVPFFRGRRGVVQDLRPRRSAAQLRPRHAPATVQVPHPPQAHGQQGEHRGRAGRPDGPRLAQSLRYSPHQHPPVAGLLQSLLCRYPGPGAPRDRRAPATAASAPPEEEGSRLPRRLTPCKPVAAFLWEQPR